MRKPLKPQAATCNPTPITEHRPPAALATAMVPTRFIPTSQQHRLPAALASAMVPLSPIPSPRCVYKRDCSHVGPKTTYHTSVTDPSFLSGGLYLSSLASAARRAPRLSAPLPRFRSLSSLPRACPRSLPSLAMPLGAPPPVPSSSP